MSEQTFVQQLVQESLPVWEKCLHSEFLERLADGTLDEACFKGYIVEDSLYLREYAKVSVSYTHLTLPTKRIV